MKRFCVMVIICLLALAVPFAALAQEADSFVSPQLVNLAPIFFNREIRETHGGQLVQVRLKISLSEEGSVQGEVQIVQSSGSDSIDQAVVKAVKRSVFRPAYKNGEAISCFVLLPLHINIEPGLSEQEKEN